ncbi:MAG: glycoside hydrolase family 43 protein [Prevotella sp.]|nr:glycoside hydrolase family 43 protein [Prevotella sp.]
MSKILSLLLFMIISESSFAQGYRNPIISGYHPDPSVCRVGSDFYLVNSSFQYFPGVPVFHSNDLINWEQIGNVLTRDSQLSLKGASSWLGIYAPTIRYNDGTYYMITTNVGNGGNFLVTATSPNGPWSEPVWLSQQGIDPSLYFEDGKVYMCSNPDDAIWLSEIDAKTGKQLSKSRMLWQGDGGRYPEGPHIYKKDGYYYLLISEGGTEIAHHLTIARSRNIYGPYESDPDNPLLTNCSRKGQNMQIQGTGHGDFVQAKDGSWWLVFLAYRNFGGSYHHLGRETYLAPVEWKKGEWPVVNGGNPIDTLMNATTLTKHKMPHAQPLDFSRGDLGPEYIHIQNPILENYIFKGNKLVLKGHGSLSVNNQPTFVGKRQEQVCGSVEFRVYPKHNAEGGISVYQINDGHYDLFVKDGRVSLRCKLKNIDYIVKSDKIWSEWMNLRISYNDKMYKFEYSDDGTSYKSLGELNCSLLSSEVAGGFTGVVIGMYADGGDVEFAQ